MFEKTIYQNPRSLHVHLLGKLRKTNIAQDGLPHQYSRMMAHCAVLLCMLGILPATRAADTKFEADPDNFAYPRPISAWTDTIKQSQRLAAQTMVAAMNAAIARGDHQFTIPPGDYRFCRAGVTNIVLRNVVDFTIEAKDAVLWFEDPFDRVDRISLVHCRNVTFRDGTVDYDPYPCSQGEVISMDAAARTVRIRIDPGFALPPPACLDPGTMPSMKAVFCNPDGVFRATPLDWVKRLKPVGERDYEATFKGDALFKTANLVRPGDRMVLPNREGRMVFAITDSEKVTVENVTVYSAPQMAFVEHSGGGGNVYRHCVVTRRPMTRRLVASNADIFHSSKVDHGPLIEDCDFGYTCDDVTNVHSFFSVVMQAIDTTHLVIFDYNAPDIEEGCELEIYKTGNAQALGKAKVVKIVPRPERTEEGKTIPAQLRALGKQSYNFQGPYFMALEVTLDRPLACDKFDFVVSNLKVARGTVMRNNYFHDSSNAGGVHINCVGGLVENNRIERTGGPGILLGAEYLFWEAPFPRDIMVRKNYVADGPLSLNLLERFHGLQASVAVCVRGENYSFPAYPTMPNSGISIIDNKIERTPTNGIFMSNTQHSTISGNTIVQAGYYPPPEGAVEEMRTRAYGIYTTFCSGITVDHNQLVNPSANNRGLSQLEGPNGP